MASKKRVEKERNKMKWNVKILSFRGFGSICSKAGKTWQGWGILWSIILWDESMFSQGYVKYILHFHVKTLAWSYLGHQEYLEKIVKCDQCH